LVEITPSFQERFIDVEVGQSVDYMLNMADFLQHDMRAPLIASVGLINSSIQRNFKTETDPSGVPWVEWNAKYAKQVGRWTETGEHTGKKLQKSQALRTAVNLGDAFIIGPDAIFFNFDALPDYGAVQNFGGPVGKGAMIPARQFVGTDDIAEQAIFDVFVNWINALAGRGGIGGGATGRGAFGQFVSLADLPA
jgi:phage gpG-like protein